GMERRSAIAPPGPEGRGNRRRRTAPAAERWSRVGPGTRLIAIALPVLVALCALGAIFSVRSYQDQRVRTFDATQALAVAAAANADRYLQGRLQLLSAVASERAFTAGDSAGMEDVLRRVRPGARGFSRGMAWIDSAGVSRVSSNGPASVNTDLSDRS